jgi:hypothetical protein
MSWVPARRSSRRGKEVISLKKLATATVANSQPIGSQLQLVKGGDAPVVVVLPNPSLKSERVQ